ncbi:MAG: TOBE domain-containing protein [Burkholderiales bacterium]|nr:TOBE domain-containing protein [Burkholderiales bacterium]MCH2242434.1 TOBE domain-containing protein [Aquabacterium sp.]
MASTPSSPRRRRAGPSSAAAPAAPRLVGRLEVNTALGSFLGDTRVRLLEAIDAHGSITQAARHVPLSYKAAWDAVDAMNNLAEEPLVDRSTGGRRGGGTRLTPYGRRMVALYRAVEAEYQAALERLASRINEGLDEADAADACTGASAAQADGAGSIRAFQRLLRRMALRTSARNQLACTVVGLREGEVEVEVFLRLDAHNELVAVVTRESVRALGLGIGSEVFVLVKSSSVLLLTDEVLTSARNQLWGRVLRLVRGPVNAEVTLDIGGGKTVTAVITHDSVCALGLAEGSRACAVFPASSVILSVVD